MIEESALRYLLLRQLWAVRQQTLPAVYGEVTRSLKVTRDHKNYIVKWSRADKSYEKVIPRSDYVFYTRGDHSSSGPADFGAETQNLRQSRLFALEALGLDRGLEAFEGRSQFRNPHEIISFFWNIIFGCILALSGDIQIAYCAMILLVALSVEFIPHIGRLLSAFALWAFVLVGSPLLALIAGAGYAFAQLLDPNPHLRRLRVVLAAGACVSGLMSTDLSIYPFESFLNGVVVLAIVLPIVTLRWTLGSHFRVLPLVVPFVSVGLMLAGHMVPTLVVVGCSLVSLFAKLWGHRVIPIQRERKLTPNG